MSKNGNVSPMKLSLINRTIVATVGALFPGIGCCLCIAYIYAFEFHRIEKSIIPVCPDTHKYYEFPV